MGGRRAGRQQSLLTGFCFALFLLTTFSGGKFRHAFAAPSPPVTPIDLSRRDCESTYEGIVYCTEEDGDVHIVIIDLHNPHIRFEMVMADDVASPYTNRRERIEDMVTRPPYQDQEVVVAINADYFGHNHGPEGLNVKNGQRLDVRQPFLEPNARTGESNEAEAAWGHNPNALWRSSLAISRFNQVSLGRKSVQDLNDPRAYRDRFYNAVGGGPLILNYGIPIPNVVACLVEGFPVGACRRKIQTIAGLSEDGRWLYLAVGKGPDVEGFARLLQDYGAFTAIKLDGGGSSQLWYDGEMRHDTKRAVGNALFLFYSPVPRHDARLIAEPQLPVVEPGARVEIGFEIENTGFLDWEPDLGYRFRNVQGWPVLGPAFQRLSEPVPAEGSLAVSLSVVAPHRPGVYEAQWQLVHRAEPIGPRLWFGLVVVPHSSGESELKEQIAARIAEQSVQPDFAGRWPALRREIERAIWREVETELRAAWCDAGGGSRTPALKARWGWWILLFGRLAC